MNNSPATFNHDFQADQIKLIMHLRRGGISDTRVLSAIEQTPREMFVDPHYIGSAYADQALPINCEQTISQPTIVACMTQALELSDRHTVLEIGTGSGYQAAVLSHLARRVHTIERHKPLYQLACQRFEALGLRNVTPHLGNGALGWERAAPYDRIIVTAAAEELPTALLSQLIDSGIMVLPMGRDNQMLYRITKQNHTYIQTPLLPVRFVPLINE